MRQTAHRTRLRLFGLVSSVLLFATLLSSKPALADSEIITSFNSDVTISASNVADITETISYDFGDTPHHGIYRNVPIDYTDSDMKSYHTNFKYLGTTDADDSGQTVQTSRSISNGNEVLKIGNPDKTVSGTHVYTIHYQLYPLVDEQNDLDHFIFDITGNGWTVPIQKATARITAPDIFSGSACFGGAAGSTNSVNCTISGTSTVLVSWNGLLSPGEGVTFDGYLAHHTVDNYLVAGKARPKTFGDIFKFVIASVPPAGAIIIGTVIFIRKRRQRHRKKAQTIVAQYSPPDFLTPVEIGYLNDNKISIVEVTATLIDLAVRGYIKINQVSAPRLFVKAEYQLVKLKEPSDAIDYEKELLGSIFASNSSVMVSALNAVAMSAAVSRFTAALKNRLEAKQYYGSFKTEKGMAAKLFESGNMTEVGATEWAKVEGLKMYLNIAEKDRLNFTDAPDKSPEQFSKLLPYAVALGVEGNWAKQFEGINVASDVGWYGGSPGFNFTAYALASDLGSGFSSAVNSNFVAPSSSGGSSGGGFGGGGGGSW